MPLLTLNTNLVFSADRKATLPALLSAEVARLLGKPESYVMVVVRDDQTMSMGGTSEGCAYLKLKSLGLPENDTASLSEALCDLLTGSLELSADRIYIEFFNPPRHMWGWNRGTFG
jgi:phenylpyruvate tautomerase PptA (4-oxalocrotonate tautomerase family)